MNSKATLQSIVVAGAAAVKDALGTPIRAINVDEVAEPTAGIDDSWIAVRAEVAGIPGGILVAIGSAGAELLADAAGGDGAGALASFLSGAVDAIGKVTGREVEAEPGRLVAAEEIAAGSVGVSFRLVLEEGEAGAVLIVEPELAPELGVEAPVPVPASAANGETAGRPTVAAASFPDLGMGSVAGAARDLKVLADVAMTVTVELGRTTLRVRDLLSLTQGSVIELDQPAGASVDILVNGTIVARGDVVVVDDELGVRVTEVVEQRAS